MLTITKEDVERIFAELVAEMGTDYRYDSDGQGCVYAYDDNRPACIVGHLVARLDLGAFSDIITAGMNEDTSVDMLVSEEVFATESPLVQNALVLAQEVQDRGATWEDARRAAEWVLSQPERFDRDHFDLYPVFHEVERELAIDIPTS